MKLILTEASHTTILLGIAGFAIALAVLLAFIVAHEFAEWWRASMFSYYLHNIASDFFARRETRRCVARMDRQLRSCGFVEVAPGRWEKRG